MTASRQAFIYHAVDLDSEHYSEWVATPGDADDVSSTVEPGRDWQWREDKVKELLSSENEDVLFLSGCAQNMGKFLPEFDELILLSAPAEIIVERLATRTNNHYGKDPDKMMRVLGLIETVEPILRKVVGHEINTNVPLEQVIEAVLRQI